MIVTSLILFSVLASDDSSVHSAAGDRVTEHVFSPIETVLKSKLSTLTKEKLLGSYCPDMWNIYCSRTKILIAYI